MNLGNYSIPIELIYILGIVFSFLTLCSLVFGYLRKKRNTETLKELVLRTRSWWFIAIGVAVVITTPPIFGTILLAYVSFVALREMFSIIGLRESDRVALFVAYFSIPVQYYLAYQNHYEQFLYFIPLVMFMIVPIVLVLTSNPDMLGRSMGLIPALLILTIYFVSHIALLFHVEVEGFEVGPGGLIMYLITITAFNDVFQFIWGKMLGKRKILPRISPNKTWEGFVGGILTSALFSYGIRFLTPLSGGQALIMGLCLGVMGFVGDVGISGIKRDLRLKDTDDLIPGHGGAMDRLDSLLVTGPVFFHLLRYFIGS